MRGFAARLPFAHGRSVLPVRPRVAAPRLPPPALSGSPPLPPLPRPGGGGRPSAARPFAFPEPPRCGGAARRGAVRGLRPRGNSRGLGAAGAVGLTGRPGPLGAAVGSRWEGSPLNRGARSYLRGSSAARGPDGKAERPNAVGPRSAGRAAPRGRTATAAASGAGRAAEGARGRLGAAPRGGAARAGEKLAETAAASQALIAARGDVTPLGEGLEGALLKSYRNVENVRGLRRPRRRRRAATEGSPRPLLPPRPPRAFARGNSEPSTPQTE